MAIKTYRPLTPSRRSMTTVDYSEITEKKPMKRLTFGKRKKAGRASHGKIAIRHRGGGAKQKLRMVDFAQLKKDIAGRVAEIAYDPNRTAHLILVAYKDGDKRYLLAPAGVSVGDDIITAKTAPLKPGNRLPLHAIPAGIPIHNIELSINRGGQIVRSAGSSATIMAKEGDWVTIKLPSSEIRRVNKNCFASVGMVSNAEHNLVVVGKAGRSRHMGRRPTVRGSVMNPVDHPHGGGEGRAPIGLKKGPKTPWGKKAMGVKTRSNKKTDQFIIQKRKKKK